ncbi:MAG: hypothetical protein ACK56F_02705 [bacterium]
MLLLDRLPQPFAEADGLLVFALHQTRPGPEVPPVNGRAGRDPLAVQPLGQIPLDAQLEGVAFALACVSHGWWWCGRTIAGIAPRLWCFMPSVPPSQ